MSKSFLKEAQDAKRDIAIYTIHGDKYVANPHYCEFENNMLKFYPYFRILMFNLFVSSNLSVIPTDSIKEIKII